MKKQEIKRRKRVMPATPGMHQIQLNPQAGTDASVSPDPQGPHHADSPSSQLQLEQAEADAEGARRGIRTIQIDYTGYNPSYQPQAQASEHATDTLHRKRSHSNGDGALEPPASRVQRHSPSIQSLLVDEPADDSAIDPSLRGREDEVARAKEEKAKKKAQKRLEAELMKERLAALENELKEMDDDEQMS